MKSLGIRNISENIQFYLIYRLTKQKKQNKRIFSEYYLLIQVQYDFVVNTSYASNSILNTRTDTDVFRLLPMYILL